MASNGQGYDTVTAKAVFQEIAGITSGALLPFDESSPDMVKALLEAIAVYAAKGMKVLEAKTNTILLYICKVQSVQDIVPPG